MYLYMDKTSWPLRLLHRVS